MVKFFSLMALNLVKTRLNQANWLQLSKKCLNILFYCSIYKKINTTQLFFGTKEIVPGTSNSAYKFVVIISLLAIELNAPLYDSPTTDLYRKLKCSFLNLAFLMLYNVAPKV